MRTIEVKSGSVYSGRDAFAIVEQMREADFEPPPTVRDYIRRASARASHYFGVALNIDANVGTEEQLAERFLDVAIAKGFAREVKSP